ncbi:MAG: DUF4199 domain-containing protein [Bacteroidetes bacterium]|jgi:hypothetical protein|nr:DUF4199 domain-containing protein [Bacteroidota bacterium]
MRRHIIKYSLIAAGCNALWMLLYVATFGIFALHWGEAFRVAILICTFSFFTYLCIKSYRQTNPNSEISMKEAMKLGILITFFATTLYAVLWAIINYYFIPDFADRFADHLIEYNRYLGKSPETMRKKIIEMDEYRVNYKKPLVNIIYSFTEILPIGIILSVINAFVLKNKKS